MKKILVAMAASLFVGCSVTGQKYEYEEEYLYMDIPPPGFYTVGNQVYIPEGQDLSDYDSKIEMFKFPYLNQPDDKEDVFVANIGLTNDIISCQPDYMFPYDKVQWPKSDDDLFGGDHEFYVVCDNRAHFLKLLTGRDHMYIVMLTAEAKTEKEYEILEWLKVGRLNMLKHYKDEYDYESWIKYRDSIEVKRR